MTQRFQAFTHLYKENTNHNKKEMGLKNILIYRAKPKKLSDLLAIEGWQISVWLKQDTKTYLVWLAQISLCDLRTHMKS